MVAASKHAGQSSSHAVKLRVVFWGTYDTGKPRVRILLKGLRSLSDEVSLIECHRNCWKDVEDKSQLSLLNKLFLILKVLLSYPSLIARYLTVPPHDVVVVAYWGLLDLFVIWPFACLRRASLVWDFFVPMYTTLTEDRRLISPDSPAGRLVYLMEFVACRIPRAVLCDTPSHAEELRKVFKLKRTTIGTVPVGAEIDLFRNLNHARNDHSFEVLFYGQFIPLHGIDTIVEAAAMSEQRGMSIKWIIVGRGQEDRRIDRLIAEKHISCVRRIEWIPYHDLNKHINSAHLCLGIFGTSIKADCVIPNKIYQICAAGAPLITADTKGAREFLTPSTGVQLVMPGDAPALLSAVVEMRSNYSEAVNSAKNAPVVGPLEVGATCLAFLREVTA